VQELQSFYADVVVKTLHDGQTIVWIRSALLPPNATQTEVDFLLTFAPGQDTPGGRYIKSQVRLPGGSLPNYAATTIDGETWYGFSYQFQWSSSDPMYQFVESALHRFVKTT